MFFYSEHPDKPLTLEECKMSAGVWQSTRTVHRLDIYLRVMVSYSL